MAPTVRLLYPAAWLPDAATPPLDEISGAFGTRDSARYLSRSADADVMLIPPSVHTLMLCYMKLGAQYVVARTIFKDV